MVMTIHKLSFYLLLVGALYMGYKAMFTHSLSPELLSNISTNDSQCSNKSHCVIFYLAPWCPSCKKILPYIDSFAEVLPEYDAGLEIIIGWDSQNKLEHMAEKISIPVIYDLEKKYDEELKVKKVPAIILIDQNGTILKQEKFLYWRTNKNASARKYISEILELE